MFKYIKQLIFRYNDDDLSSMSAQITYFMILAFFPFLIFLITLLSFTPISKEILIRDFSKFLPQETGILLKGVIIQTLQVKSKTLLFVSIIGSLWAASKGINAIRKGLNKSYDIEETRNFFHLSLISLGATLGVSIMIIFSFIMIVLGKILGDYVFGLLGAQVMFNFIWSVLRYFIPLIIMFFTFSFIFRYVPNRKLKFKNVVVGTVFTTVGWIVTSLVFSFYVNNFGHYEKVYGSLGGAISLIVWLYISTLIILVGGELNVISNYFQDKEENKKYDSIKLNIPLLDKVFVYLKKRGVFKSRK